MSEQIVTIRKPVAATTAKSSGIALFNLGFRPFFLLGGLFAILSMAAWGGVYFYGWHPAALPVAAMDWHAHEMIYGYGMAVVAGFLLTAVRNWTQLPTFTGVPLALLVALWAGARVLGVAAPNQVWAMFLFDALFNIALSVAVTLPVVRARQKQQIGMVSKVHWLTLGNVVYYLGALGVLEHGVQWGLYTGLYLLLTLMFAVGRRVIPFFIERGVGYPVKLRNWLWVDRASLVLMLLFWIVDVFTRQTVLASILAGLLVVVHTVRLYGWYTPGIWSRPLLWILYVGYATAVFGFLLAALTPPLTLSPYLAVHAFAVGGIGMMTVGMMARVSLGHTGRDVRSPSWLLPWVFVLLMLAFAARVLLPLVGEVYYLSGVVISQVLWIVAFGLFLGLYAPILIKPRVDGLPD
jgi:uncharacterized protein involved in response to NO